MNIKKLKIKHPIGIIINKKLDVADLLNNEKIQVRDLNNGYVWYKISDTKIKDYFLVFSLCFYHNKLNSFNFYASLEPNNSDWSNWSKEYQLKRVQESKDWIQSLGYDIGEYDWGTISVQFDAKGGSGGGTIRLK